MTTIFSSESSDVAVDVFNKQGLLPYLVSSLKTDIYPRTVAIPAGEMLVRVFLSCTVTFSKKGLPLDVHIFCNNVSNLQ